MDDADNDQFFCDVCNINLYNEASIQQHISGRKHLDLVRAKEERLRVESKCGIYVRGFPPNLGSKALIEYFAKFGTVVWSHYGDSFLLLDYSHPAAARDAMKRKHYLHGRSVIVKYRELKPSRDAFKEQVELISDNLLDQIKNMSDLEHQFSTLAYILQGEGMEFLVYDKICQDLYGTLIHSFPRCQIFPFGSTVTGLGFKSSDIDVYIAGIRHGDNNVPLLYKIRTILRHSQLFTNAIVIANAKIPILKCVHIQSGMNCDINIRNMLGVCNSNLINYYLNLDMKIRRIMLFIKYWAKTHKLTGQNHLFTNYSLSLMLIFFLQLAPYNVPSVFSLQDFRSKNMQDGWNGGFSKKNFYNKHLKGVSLVGLLSEFFKFYSEFDYGVYVIVPYLGVPIKKSDFKDPKLLYDSVFFIYKRYIEIEGNLPLKVDASICVQDPFEHSRNTTPIVSDSTLNIFVNLCCLGRKLCEEGETGLLYRLVNETPPNVMMELLTNSNFVQFSIPMSLNTKYLKKKLEEKVSNDTIEKMWFKSVNEFLLIVLKDFLNIEVRDITEESTNSKAKKAEGQNDVHDKEESLYSYRCAAKLNFWQNRKAILKNINKAEASSVVEREVEVTKQLMALYKDINLRDNIVEFEISLVSKYDPPQMLISVTKITSYKKTFKVFSHCLASNFTSWFETYEKELNS
ncbi:unnamed protein product [Phaedon cochleariae]|uniref:Nucleoporin NUP35 n=1 Tax=Phaedon cochleariae TaxID=80249 RepID=A0A9P0DKU4_PHACE|nr:unnamed protein product [Phaedon cochleariae]